MSVQKPDYSHSIVNVLAGHVIPGTFLNMLCNQNRSCVGLVVREPGKIEIERFLNLGTVEDQIALLSKVNDNTKKYPRQFIFGSFPVEFDEEECQPWIPVRDSKNNPLVTVSIEGDFPGRTSAEGFSEAHVLMHEYLGDKLNDAYKLAGNNPSKLFDYLNSDSFKKDLTNTFGFRAAFAFMPSVGDPIMLGNFREEGKGGADYTWGSASFNYGYADPVEEKPPVPEPKAKAPASSKYADAPIEPKPSVPEVPLKTDPPKPEEKVAKDIVDNSTEEGVWWQPPATLHGKALKKAYRDMLNNELPTNWQERPKFFLKAKKEVTAAGPKDMRPTAQPTVLPVIDGKQQVKAVDFIKKYLGDGAAVLEGNPLEVQKQESNLAVFSEICLKSNDLAEINRWPVSGVFAFAKENPEAAALLIIQLRREFINRTQLVKDGDKKLGDLTGTEQVGVPSPGPQPAPTKPAEVTPALPEPRRASGGASKYM